MRALVFDGQRASVAERPEPDVGEGQVIARTLLAGICNTDLEIVLVVGHHESHLALARERGIDVTLEQDWDRRASELVVEATGTASGFVQAMSSTVPRGTLVLKSTVAARQAFDLAPLVINEITVVGSRCGPFAPALAALASGAVEVRPMVEQTLALADGTAALAKAAERGALKSAGRAWRRLRLAAARGCGTARRGACRFRPARACSHRPSGC